MSRQVSTELVSIDSCTFATRGNVGGWAHWYDDQLSMTGHFADRQMVPHFPLADVVIEIPQVYNIQQSRVDPNDLIRLAVDAGVTATICAPGSEAKFITPREWKGQKSKSAVEKQVLEKLSFREKLVLEQGMQHCRKSWHHNIVEAVGIGLWQVGRLRR